jgi:hypothetical protein
MQIIALKILEPFLMTTTMYEFDEQAPQVTLQKDKISKD